MHVLHTQWRNTGNEGTEHVQQLASYTVTETKYTRIKPWFHVKK